MKTIITFLNFRLKQTWRSIQEIGIPLIIIFLLVTISFSAKLLVILTQVEGYDIAFISMLLIGGLHITRKDASFLKSLNVSKKLLVFFEYTLLLLPVSIILFFMGKMIPMLFWHLGILPVLLLPIGNLQKGNNKPFFSFRSIPIKYFEIRTGLRRTLIFIFIFYILALGTSFFNGTLVLWSLFAVMMIPMFFEHYEPKEMIQPLYHQGDFLQKKVTQHFLIFQITMLPHYFLFLFFHSQMWYLALASFIGISLSIIFSIVYKYSTYRPILPKMLSKTFHAIFFWTLVMPGFAIVSVGLIIYFWKKANNNLAYYYA